MKSSAPYFLLALALLSCSGRKEGPESAVPPGIPPIAVLRAGEFPLWFVLEEDGPVHLTDIGGAVNAAALVPWPHARHLRFLLAGDEGLSMAVNWYGFLRLAREERGLALYAVPAEPFARAYTVGAFLSPGADGAPFALLYRDDWFAEPELPPPEPRFWTFDPDSGLVLPLRFPAFDPFPADRGWDVTELHLKGGAWYFRTFGPGPGRRDTLFLRAESLDGETRRITPGEFRAVLSGESPDAAGPLLSWLLRILAAETGASMADLVLPDFGGTRRFDLGGNGPGLYAFSPGDSLLALFPDGRALYLEPDLPTVRFALPPLPENFVYSGVAAVADTVFAAWEERIDFNVGAAGFMVIRPDLGGLGGD